MDQAARCFPVSPPAEFTLLQQLRGGSSPVYRARLHADDALMHLKVVRERRLALRTARILRRVASPFAPALLGLWGHEDEYWIGSEWIDGSVLDVRSAELRHWLPGLLRALVHLHRRGVVHGDLKPENILLDLASGRVVLVDFDFAARTGEQLRFEETGGTEGFVAPERLAGWPADPRSDLFSVGRILQARELLLPALADLAHALTGRRPADRPPDAARVLAQVSELIGPGLRPPPVLELFGWRRERTTAGELAAAMAWSLGIDGAIGLSLANALLGLSGGQREFAAEMWRTWLPKVITDPWCPVDGDQLEAGLPLLREIAIRLQHKRFYRFVPRLRNLAARLAQVGFSGSRAMLAEVAGLPSDSWRELEAIGVVRYTTPDEARYEFANPPLWGVALRALSPLARCRAHARMVAREQHHALPEDASDLPSEELAPARIAWHLEEAGSRDEAIRHWFDAAQGALERGHNAAALRFAAHAWWLCDASGGGPPHAVLQPDSTIDGEPLPEPRIGLSSDWSEEEFLHRIELFSALVALAGRIDAALAWIGLIPEVHRSPRARALYHTNMARQLERAGRWREMREHAEAGLRIAMRVDDRAVEGRLRMHRAQTLLAARDHTEGQREAQRAVSLLASEESAADRCTALQLVAIAALRQQDGAVARRYLETALELAQRAGSAFVSAAAHMNLSVCAHHGGDLEVADRHLRAALGIARMRNLPQIRWAALANLGLFAMRAERWRESSDRWREALIVATQAGRRVDRLHASVGLVQALIRAGFLARAERILREVEGAFPLPEVEAEERPGRLRLALRHIELHVLFRRLPADDRVLREALALARGMDSRPLAAPLRVAPAAHALLAGSDTATALMTLGDPPDESATRGWYYLIVARAWAQGGEMAQAEEAFRAALAAFATLHPGRFECACAWLDRALLAPDPEPRSEALGRCIALAQAVDARWIEVQALRLRTSPEQLSLPDHGVANGP
jgi:serine/threonine protein kinase